MASDNMYPNDGSTYFPMSEPADQKRDREIEESKAVEALPVLQELVKHFETRIAARDSIKGLGVDVSDYPELHQRLCAVNELLVEALTQEKQLIEELIGQYAPK